MPAVLLEHEGQMLNLEGDRVRAWSMALRSWGNRA
jgi:hypothetical protein